MPEPQLQLIIHQAHHSLDSVISCTARKAIGFKSLQLNGSDISQVI